MVGKKFGLTFLITLFFCLLVISPKTSITSYAASSEQKLFDDANLFDAKEREKLESIIEENEEKGEVDIVIITTYDIEDKTNKEFLEDFYDNHRFGYNKESGDTTLMLINMDPGNRSVEIQGYGKAQFFLHDDRIEHILDDIVPLLSERKFFEASELFSKQVSYYMNEEKGVNIKLYEKAKSDSSIDTVYYGVKVQDGPSNYYGENNTLKNILVRVAISMGVGIIVVVIMAFNSSGKVTTSDRTYLDSSTSRVIAHHDTYIRTSTTKVRKPTSSSSGGGRSSGGGGRSSGGRSHSGGGRSF